MRLKDCKLDSVLEDEGYVQRKNPESLVQTGKEYV